MKCRWRQVQSSPSNILPLARHCHHCTNVGDLIIVFFGGNRGIVNQTSVFNIATQEWYQPACHGDIPPGFAAYGLAKIGQFIYVHGGVQANENFSNDMYELNVDDWTWKRHKLTDNCPSARIGHSLVEYEGKLYLFGGRNESGQCLNDFYCCDLKSWSIPVYAGKVPCPRDSHSCVVHKASDGVARMIIFGGNTAFERLNDTFIFLFATSSWVQIDCAPGEIPSARSCHSACMVDERMIVFGGWTNEKGDSQLDCTNTVYEFDVLKNAWNSVSFDDCKDPLPCPRAAHSAVAVCSRMYIIGGRNRVHAPLKEQICVRDVWTLDFESPCAPSTLRIMSVRENSIRIQWKPVGCADLYLIQIRECNDSGDQDLGLSSTQGGESEQLEEINVCTETEKIIDRTGKAIEQGDVRIGIATTKSVTPIDSPNTPPKVPGPTIVRVVDPLRPGVSTVLSRTGQQIINLTGLTRGQCVRLRLNTTDPCCRVSSPRIINLTAIASRKSLEAKPSIDDDASPSAKDESGTLPQFDGQADDDSDKIEDEDSWNDVGLVHSCSCLIEGYWKRPLGIENSFTTAESKRADNKRIKLSASKCYYIRILAVNALGLSAASETCQCYTYGPDRIDVPRNIRCSRNIASDSVRMSWEPVYVEDCQQVKYALYMGTFDDNGSQDSVTFKLVYVGTECECVIDSWKNIGSSAIFRLTYQSESGLGPVVELRVNSKTK